MSISENPKESGNRVMWDQIDRLNAENDRLRAALQVLRSYAASVWFDEADATDEEREIMRLAWLALDAE